MNCGILFDKDWKALEGQDRVHLMDGRLFIDFQKTVDRVCNWGIKIHPFYTLNAYLSWCASGF